MSWNPRKSNATNRRSQNKSTRRLSHENLEARQMLALVISEVLYNHNGGGALEPAWEWFEVYNSGPGSVDLTGYVADDENSNAHAEANIAAGSIAENSVAVFFNVDRSSAADFEAVWGSNINLIPVTSWSNMSLGNGGDKISLWSSFANYTATATEHQLHASALISIAYDDGAPWPADNGSASIYLTDLATDMNVGGNWALSSAGVDGGFQSNLTAGNLGDVGSPGFAPGTEVLPSVVVQQTDGSTTVSENGATDTYNLGLATVPTGSVEITVTADAQTLVSLDGNNFSSSVVASFTDDVTQVVTIQAVDDVDIEAGHNSVLTHEITATNDPTDYPTSLSISNIEATVLDNDVVIDLVVTEIMFNPNSSDTSWEWIEVYNAGPIALDLSGFVIDDNNPTFHGSANIAAGTIPSGGTGVLYDVSTTDFAEAWNNNINLIAVENWGNLSLGNNGDVIGIWDSFIAYEGDHVNHANVVSGVEYGVGGDWPTDNSAESIYLLDAHSDPSAPANWALSVIGIFGAYESSTTVTNLNTGMDVGSPGLLPRTPNAPSITISSVGPNGNEVGEDGTSDTYNVFLNTVPTGDVEVTIATDNQTEVSLDGLSFSTSLALTFSDVTPQTVIIRGVDDAIIETDHHSLIGHEVTTTADATYPVGMDIADISFGVEDDDFALSDLIFSEIMFSPDSSDGFWEWVEVYNRSSSAISLNGYVLDDNNVAAHTTANISSGSVPAGGTAILYNSAVTSSEFGDAWGSGLNLVPVAGWTNIGLGNGNDQVGIWSSLAAYNGDNEIHANALTSQPYDTGAPWPVSDNASSIYMRSVNANPHDGSSWALSVAGVDGARMSSETGDTALNTGLDVGSPGAIPADLIGPTILSASVNTGIVDPPDKVDPQPTSWATQRSEIATIQLTFDDDVQLANNNEIVLTNLGINAPADPDFVVPVTNDQISINGTVATISFGVDDLESGVYELQITNTFTDGSGNPLDGDDDGSAGGTFVFAANAVNNFYELTSEFSGDTGVSVFDFSTFSYWFGDPTGVAPEYVDMNRDGGVSVFDFSFFSSNFSIGVTFPAAFAAAIFAGEDDQSGAEIALPAQQEPLDVIVDWAVVGDQDDLIFARLRVDGDLGGLQKMTQTRLIDEALLEFLGQDELLND